MKKYFWVNFNLADKLDESKTVLASVIMKRFLCYIFQKGPKDIPNYYLLS